MNVLQVVILAQVIYFAMVLSWNLFIDDYLEKRDNIKWGMEEERKA